MPTANDDDDDYYTQFYRAIIAAQKVGKEFAAVVTAYNSIFSLKDREHNTFMRLEARSTRKLATITAILTAVSRRLSAMFLRND